MTAPTTYFIYARKSTDVEDKQVRSIDAQLAELRELAHREGLVVAREFVERESAKAAGARRVFNDMLSRVEAGEANAILAWHPDRLARNPFDGGRIIGLLDAGTLRRLRFFGSMIENSPQGKMLLTMEFGFSKYFIDSLAENVKRGVREKVRRGEYPSVAPIGYLNDRRVKRIAVDRERAPLVREMFERYSTGTETLEDARLFLASRGVRSRNGRVLCRAQVSNILSNPIYYGHFRWSDELHQGVHEPITSKQVFDKVQAVLSRRWRYSPATVRRVPKPFLRLLRCADCGGAITAEIQKEHTYYRCTKKLRRDSCHQPYVRSEVLDVELSALLRPFALRKEWGTEMLGRIELERKSAIELHARSDQGRRAELETHRLRLERLTEALIDGLIGHDDFRANKARILGEMKRVEEALSDGEANPNAWLEPFAQWVRTAIHVGEIADGEDLVRKRALAEEVFGSNLVLDLRKPRGKAINPWSLIAEHASGDTSVTLYNAARTHFQGQRPSCSGPKTNFFGVSPEVSPPGDTQPS